MSVGAVIGGAALGLIGASEEADARRKAAREQERIDEENIRLQELELEETIRRTEEVNRQTEGFAVVQASGSGFAIGSSLDMYVESIRRTHEQDINWMRTSGASRTAIAEREAEARSRNARASARASTISNIGGIIGGVAESSFQW